MTIPPNPWHFGSAVLDPFRRELKELTDRFFGGHAGTGRTTAGNTWSPRLDVEETGTEIVVKVDLPGVDPKNVEISVENGVLTIRGETTEEKTEEKKQYHCVERFAGAFYRQISLPAGADPDRVTATSTNGLVTISISKKFEAQPKKVAITPKP